MLNSHSNRFNFNNIFKSKKALPSEVNPHATPQATLRKEGDDRDNNSRSSYAKAMQDLLLSLNTSSKMKQKSTAPIIPQRETHPFLSASPPANIAPFLDKSFHDDDEEEEKEYDNCEEFESSNIEDIEEEGYVRLSYLQ